MGGFQKIVGTASERGSFHIDPTHSPRVPFPLTSCEESIWWLALAFAAITAQYHVDTCIARLAMYTRYHLVYFPVQVSATSTELVGTHAVALLSFQRLAGMANDEACSRVTVVMRLTMLHTPYRSQCLYDAM